MNMTTGSVVEHLIYIKDKNRKSLTPDEIDAINNACNILNHRFLRMADAESLVDDSVAGYDVSKVQVMDWLHEAGFLGNESNLAYLMAQEMPETMALCMRHKAEEVIHDFIRMYRKELERR